MRPATEAFQDKCSQCIIAKYPRHGISYDRGCQCKNLFWLGQSAPKMDRMDAFQDRCSQCVIAKYPRHGISYDRGCQCKNLFWLGQSAPKMDAFSTDVLNVTLQNTPDMVSLMTEVVNVKPFFGQGKVPPKWTPLAQCSQCDIAKYPRHGISYG